ncbi:MAG TPA: AraC family transcriptional regulator [Solirubrobacteraceae bacterium]|jgi:AraC-like DNA-binding protein|nr:AraC family transcriptional regulator [Solirubrobacteraceae bacterium]
MDAAALAAAVGIREETRLARQLTVERAVQSMRADVAAPMSLDALARAAMFSPYHFHRMFRAVTGVPPAQFQCAIRMEIACRLLLTTQMRVIDVCCHVGFGSPGTFTTRFARLVGTSPKRLRHLAARHAGRSLTALATDVTQAADRRNAPVTGWIETPAGVERTVIVGLFPETSGHCQPQTCAVVRAPGPFITYPVPAGMYRLIAAGYPTTVNVVDAVLLDARGLLLARFRSPMSFRPGQPARAVHLRMRRSSALDPPAVLAAPLLIAERGEPPLAGPRAGG